MSSLEAELSEVKIQTHIVEQENLLLKDELEKIKQVRLYAAYMGARRYVWESLNNMYQIVFFFLPLRVPFTESC